MNNHIREHPVAVFVWICFPLGSMGTHFCLYFSFPRDLYGTIKNCNLTELIIHAIFQITTFTFLNILFYPSSKQFGVVNMATITPFYPWSKLCWDWPRSFSQLHGWLRLWIQVSSIRIQYSNHYTTKRYTFLSQINVIFLKPEKFKFSSQPLFHLITIANGYSYRAHNTSIIEL